VGNAGALPNAGVGWGPSPRITYGLLAGLTGCLFLAAGGGYLLGKGSKPPLRRPPPWPK
jgi:hypothetical protein